MDAITRSHYRRWNRAPLVQQRRSVAMMVHEDGTRVVLVQGACLRLRDQRGIGP